MNLPSPQPLPLSDLARAEQKLAEQTLLVQRVREELIRSQITVLELQDTILQKETDKADAVSLLGQAELVLEGKINYIFELDRTLNERIASLQQELTTSRSAHETITADLVQRLDQTNRELGAAHTLAGNYARDAANAQSQLAATVTQLQELQLAHHATQTQLSAAAAEYAAVKSQLDAVTQANTALRSEISEIHGSFVYKLASFFRPKPRQQP